MTTVLLADDHQLLRQAVRRALEDAGFSVAGEAGDGEEAADLAASLLGQFRQPSADGPAPSPLTKREEEILQQVADGRSTTEVARELFISAKTVKNHLASIYVKLDARDRTQAVLSGVRMGIVHLR